MTAWNQTSVDVQVFGLCRIYISPNPDETNFSNFTALGYSQNGVTIFSDPYTLPVFSDERGGEDGPPVEIQTLGETHRVTIELSKWSQFAAYLVQLRGHRFPDVVQNSFPEIGTPTPAGALLFAGKRCYQLLLECIGVDAGHQPFTTRVYPRCVIMSQTELSPGTRFSRLVFEFTAYANDEGTLYTDN